MIVLVFETKDEAGLKQHLEDRGIAYYEMEHFFEIEGFKTLEEVECWWEDK